jgi:chorismate mutase
MPRKQTTPEVLELREEIARLDHSLVMLIAARQDAARRLFAVKERVGLPLFDPAQESLVISRARRWGREVGAAPDEVGSVFERVISVARRGAARRRNIPEEPGVVTVLLAVPPALPRVRVERSPSAGIVAGLPPSFDHGHDEDHPVGPSDDHHLGPDHRRPKPATHHHIPA